MRVYIGRDFSGIDPRRVVPEKGVEIWFLPELAALGRDPELALADTAILRDKEVSLAVFTQSELFRCRLRRRVTETIAGVGEIDFPLDQWELYALIGDEAVPIPLEDGGSTGIGYGPGKGYELICQMSSLDLRETVDTVRVSLKSDRAKSARSAAESAERSRRLIESLGDGEMGCKSRELHARHLQYPPKFGSGQ